MSEVGQKLIAAVRAAAEDRPDYVYEKAPVGASCVYVRDGQPSCIVGQGLWDVGLIDAAFQKTSINSDGVEEMADYLDLDLDSREMDWLTIAQDYQDRGHTWAAAVSAADGLVVEFV